MALPLPPGLTPAEVAFQCENELIFVVPRQRMDSIPLLTGPTPVLRPPHPAEIPLWLALLLHRQNRALILPPAWLSISSLETILNNETTSAAFSRGLHEYTSAQQVTVAALPYHYLSIAHILLSSCPTSFDPSTLGQIGMLVRSIREVRQSKMREGLRELEGGGVVSLRGVGGLEVAEERGFVTGVVSGLRKLAASKEAARLERGDDDASRGDDRMDEDEEDMEMSLEPSSAYTR